MRTQWLNVIQALSEKKSIRLSITFQLLKADGLSSSKLKEDALIRIDIPDLGTTVGDIKHPC